MKNYYRQWVVLVSAGIVAGGLGFAAVESVLEREGGGGGRSVQVKVDDRPLARDGKLAASYAPAVKQTAPAVVNIFTTKIIRGAHGPGLMPFFDDPMFRRFFGPPFEGEGQPRQRSFTQRSLGSGVVVSADGYILTNDHVVDGADEIKVKMERSRQEHTAKVIGRDPQTDLALLKIEAEELTFATFADSDHVDVGDVVLAIGNPFGIGQTVTLGIVSAVGRGGMGIEDYEDFIQTDAAINPGNSGGALVDPEGRLVGINTAILSRTGGNHGVGFAIPANLARSVMDQLVQDGRVERGFLGVSIQDLTPELAEEFDIKSEGGALVAEVSEDSAAKTAGLKRGDVIVEVNGKPVRDSRSLRLLIGDLRPGTEAKLNCIREGKQRTATARLKAAPGNLARRLPEGDREGGPADEGALRGVRVGTITEEVRRQYSVPPEVEGVAVLEVDPESASFQAGLRPGDVLLEINRQRVRSAEEAIEACRNSRGGRTLVNFWRQGGHRYVVVKENLEE